MDISGAMVYGASAVAMLLCHPIGIVHTNGTIVFERGAVERCLYLRGAYGVACARNEI